MVVDRPLYIYLDQKDWINLGRAYYGRSDGDRYKPVLKKILELVEKNKAIFPLSATHVIETSKRRNRDSKIRLATVMAEISLGHTIANQSYLAISELNSILSQKFSNKIAKVTSAFSMGIPFAFGINYRLFDEKNNPVRIDANLTQVINNTLANKSILIEALVGKEENLINIIKEIEESRQKHVKAAEEFRKRVRDYDKKLLKRAYIANLIEALYDDLNKLLLKHQQTFESFLKIGEDQFEPFFAQIPTLDTEIELATRRNEHWDKRIDGNDVSDIRALSVAIPYCDIVVTEVFWTNVAQFTGLNKKYNTNVVSSLDELLLLLN